MLQRLDIRTARFDRFTDTVKMDGRGIVVSITKDALENLANRSMEDQEAVLFAIDEVRRFTRLAEVIPADDGTIQITRDLTEANGMLSETSRLSDVIETKTGRGSHAD